MNSIIKISLLFLLAGCYGKEPVKTEHIGEVLPKFSILLLDSSSYFNSGNIASNKPVVLFYFGPHCPYSKAQMQEIVDNMDKLHGVQFMLLTLAPLDQVKEFYKKYNLSRFNNVAIGIDYSQFFRKYFKPAGVPYLAIYGSDKKLNNLFAGNTSASLIRSEIK